MAEVLSFEEYYPYGSTSYEALSGAVKGTAKRYRYTGMERDEETGLAAQGVRYYASWLGRWTSSDPLGIADGVNTYAYCRNNPLVLTDRSGNGGERAPVAEPPPPTAMVRTPLPPIPTARPTPTSETYRQLVENEVDWYREPRQESIESMEVSSSTTAREMSYQRVQSRYDSALRDAARSAFETPGTLEPGAACAALRVRADAGGDGLGGADGTGKPDGPRRQELHHEVCRVPRWRGTAESHGLARAGGDRLRRGRRPHAGSHRASQRASGARRPVPQRSAGRA